jgi:CDP-diacylglycerol--glycerol-3-phosphate 3-phosphatidyltransferase
MAAGFLFVPAPEGILRWAPPILYTTAIVADLFDGVLARRANFATLLGARLDIELDGLGVLLALLLAVHLGQLSPWFIAVGLARPLFAVGLWWRRRQGLPTFELPPSRHRKLLAGIQMGFLSAALWPVLGPQALTLIGVCVLLPTVVGFGRDWLVVSGRIVPSGRAYELLDRWNDTVVVKGLPLLLRLLMPAAFVSLWLYDPLLESAVILFAMMGMASIAVGVLGRVGAILLIIAVGVHAAIHGLDPLTSILLAGASSILVFGTGPASLWKPEEAYILSDVDAGV